MAMQPKLKAVEENTMGHKGRNSYGFETNAIHAGTQPDPTTGCRQVPIYQTASFSFKSSDYAAGLFDLTEEGYVYSRLTNPTVDALERRVAVLEGGVGATAAASGIAGHLLAFFNLMSPGDDFLFSKRIYGGTYNQMGESFRRLNWNGIAVDPDDPENFRKALTPKTKLIFAESMANPSGFVLDIEAVAKIAHEAGIPLIVDNTIPTPYLCRPIEWGADIVVHSTTKYLSGNGSAMGGIVVDAGSFDWLSQKEKFPYLADKEPSYHNRNLAEEFGNKAFTVAAHAVGLRDLGASQAPMNAFLTLNGIETLHLRMERHSSNALKVAQFLDAHPKVETVSYVGLENHPQHALAKKYMPKGQSSLFTFDVKGGFAAGKGVVEHCELFSLVANIGDSKSLIIHPASSTHSQVKEEDMKKVGITPGTLRISIGLETAEDIIADLDQALSKV